MDDKRFEELRQKVMEASVGISPYGTSPNYGSSSGVDPAETLGFLNKQSAHDEEWKAAKAFYNGIVVQGARGITGALKMARDYNVYSRREKDPNYQPMEEGMAILDNLEKSSALQRYDIRANSTLGQFGLDLTEGAGQLLGQVGATALTGGVGGLAIMGTQIAGNQYLDLRNAGVEVPRAAIASLGNAALQAPMEQLSLGKMMKALPAGSSLKKKVVQVLESALTEGTTEFLQQYPEEMANIYAMNKGKDVRQMAAEFDRQFVDITKEAAYSGAIGALLGSGGSSINVALERHAHNAKVEALQERIDAERKSGINADFVAGTVNTNLQGSTIAVDGEALLQYAQTKNPEEVAKALGVELQEIEKAAENGLSVDVLQGNFEATELKIPGFLDAVKDDINFSDGGYSPNKEKYQRLLQEETDKIKARDTDLQEQLDTIFNSMRDAGANKQTATAMMDMYRAAAVAANPYDPAQYFKDHPVEFRRDGDILNSQTFGNLEYSQAAMKKSEAQSLADFYKEVTESNVDPEGTGKKYYSFVTDRGAKVDVTNDDALHFGNKHKLTAKQFSGIEDNLEHIVDYEIDEKKKGHYGGRAVRAKINTPAGVAGVTLEFLGNGRIFMTTAFFDTEANIENWLNRKEGAGRSTLKNLDASFDSQPSQEGARTSKLEFSNPSAFAGQPPNESSQTLGIESEGQQNRLLGSLSLLDIIKDKLGIVKEDKFKQTEDKLKTEAFQKWFGKSKVVDENGKPLVVYHGTNAEFNAFDKNKIGSATDDGIWGRGFYFGSSSDTPYGTVKMPVYLKMENPFLVNDYNTVKEIADYIDVWEGNFNFDENNKVVQFSQSQLDQITSHIKEKGHDGIIVKLGDQWTEYVVFEPSQIKSVNNEGTFDTDDSNIYKQTAYHGSPFKFKKFDMGAIGTGEGAQAHGWGLYFAKNKKIASNNYRFIGKAYDNSVTFGGKPILDLAYNLANIADNTDDHVKAQEYYDKVTIIEDVESSGTTAGITVEKYPEAAVKWFKREIKPRVRIKGSLFEVDIPENDVLLDENKALAKQDKNVKSLLKKFYAGLDKDQAKVLKENLKQSLKKGSLSEEYEESASRKKEIDLTLSRLRNLEPKQGEPKFAAKIREFSISELRDAGYDIERLKTDQQYYDSIVEPLKAEQTALQEALTTEEESIETAYNEELRRIERSRGAGLFEGNVTGGDLYAAISEVFGNARDASEALNVAGIKGITYYGDLDGRCFVVFDDQAIKVINKYNQKVNSGETKGGIGWDEAGKAIINLFSEADASTVIHESGHFFVENLARDVNEGRATEQQSKDWQTMLKYAEITNEEWLNMDMEGRRAAHERWAEGFETYIMEGSAPSRELRSVFKKFADWLKAIYEKYKRNTNAVPLNDDVRQVFDRMLASEEDIREMERINGYFAKLPKVITDSLSENSKKRIADYMLKAEDKAIELLTKQSLANFSEDRKERIDAFRADILSQIRDELSKSPLYSACADVEAYTMDTHQKAKTVARRYLNEDGREYTNWREELDAVQGDIRDRLLPIIEQLQSGMNQGVAFVRDPETGKYVRHSNNDYWYSLWYKQHGRMLTKQDLRQLAYDIYTGERSDVLPGWENDSVEAAEHFKDAKAELDELMQREQELLEQKDDVGKYRYRGLNKEDRITFDLLAERYNYSSGSELAQEIMREPTLERAITLKADAMVQEAFPDIYKERALAEQAAREAFYNDDTGLVIGLEQQLIEDKAAVTLVQERSLEARERLAQARRQQAKLAAKKELTQISVRDAIRTDRFIAAERKAAAQAATALAKEDYAAALRYKNKQALNHAMARESLLMKDTVNTYKRYINRQFSAKRETWFNDEHFSQAAAIMQRMGFRRRDYDPDMRLASLADYAAKMQDLYDNVDIAGWILNEENSLRNPLQMTFGQFEDVVNALKNIKAIAKANKGDNLLGGAMDYAGYQAKAADNLRKLKTKYKPILGERQTAGYWETFLSSMKNTDNLFEGMDNASYGFFSKTMGSAIKNSNDSEAIHKIKFEERIAAAYREWLPDKAAEEAADHKEYYEELGTSADKHTLTKLLMNLGNEGNARVLCTTVPAGIAADSELWVNPGYGVTREEAIEQTKANLLEFLGKVLTKEDIRYAQKKVDIAGMYWEEMSALDRRTKGFAPRKVEALPVEMILADGEKVVFRGGYFPLIRDRQMGSSPQGQVPIADTDSQQGRNIRTLSTSNGNLKERVEALYPIDLTRGAEFKVMDNSIHDLCWRETMSDFRKLFNDEHMYGLMKEKLGIAQLQAFREMLEKAAQPNGTASADLAETALSQTASWLRRKTVNVAIMLNMKTAVQNFGNIFLYGRVVEGFGYSDVLTAMGNWHMNLQSAGNYKSMDELIMEKSVFMRERSVLPDITLRDLYAEGKMNKLERQTVKWGTKMLVYTDNLTAKPIWLQAYMKKINSGAGEREAVDFADLVIRRTLGSSRITDVSSLQRGGKLFKLFTTFQGFFNTQFNQWVREANIDMRLWNEGHKGKALMNITAFVAAKYVVFCLVNLALAFEDPFEEDEDEWLKISKELTHYPMSLMGPIGQAGNALLDQMLGMKSYGYRMSAIQSSIDSSLRMGKKLHKIIADDDPLSDLIEPATGLAGTVIGVPQQLNKWFFNAYDMLFNDMDAEFGDFYRRRPKKER